MEERNRKQEEEHGAREALAGCAITGAEIGDDGDDGERAKADGDEQERGGVKSRGSGDDVRDMEKDGNGAEEIPGHPQDFSKGPERDLQEHGGQEAQGREADGGDDVGGRVVAFASREADERSGVPQHGEGRGQGWKDAAIFACAPPADDEEIEEDPEDENSGAMANGVDQDGTVNEPVRHLSTNDIQNLWLA